MLINAADHSDVDIACEGGDNDDDDDDDDDDGDDDDDDDDDDDGDWRRRLCGGVGKW